jgi:hypothetical protein
LPLSRELNLECNSHLPARCQHIRTPVRADRLNFCRPAINAQHGFVYCGLEFDVLWTYRFPIARYRLSLVGKKLSAQRANLQDARTVTASHADEIFSRLLPRGESTPVFLIDVKRDSAFAVNQGSEWHKFAAQIWSGYRFPATHGDITRVSEPSGIGGVNATSLCRRICYSHEILALWG